MGGKSKIGKKLAEILNESLCGERDFVEPFVGGFNIVPHIETSGLIHCFDANEALIALYQAIQDGWEPPDSVSEEEYKAAKLLPDSDPLKAFIAFGCSFGGKWFGGYARCASGKMYSSIARQSISRKFQGVSGVAFDSCSYEQIDLRIGPMDEPCVIYCDPPYAETTSYSGAPKFDHEAFWEWCGWAASKGHDVFVSEYECPIPHEVVFEKEQTTTLDKSHKKAVEKMFKIQTNKGESKT